MTEAELSQQESRPSDSSEAQWAGVGVVVLVLVMVAFVSGWRLGRTWGRLVGW